MSNDDKINRRDFLKTTAGASVSVGALLVGAQLGPAYAAKPDSPLPPDLDNTSPIGTNWGNSLSTVAVVDLPMVAPELKNAAVKERHQIYCLLLMKLIQRFWNGNKRGPLGVYPQRKNQKELEAGPNSRYRGDWGARPDNTVPKRISWDRYLGHNIACLAADGNGEIIDFDFNHNDFFRSSAEHAEARLVRRLFSLADICDGWRTGRRIPNKSRAASLTDVTLYTSLESCAQCSGVMSLGRVKQVVFLQHDPGAYRIGNIMYNLAGPDPGDSKLSLAPLPIPAHAIDLKYHEELDMRYKSFADDRTKKKEPFFTSPDGKEDHFPSITSFLCTDAAFDIFSRGGEEFDKMSLSFSEEKSPGNTTSWTNKECLIHAQRFYAYADAEGFRGSPHKL